MNRGLFLNGQQHDRLDAAIEMISRAGATDTETTETEGGRWLVTTNYEGRAYRAASNGNPVNAAESVARITMGRRKCASCHRNMSLGQRSAQFCQWERVGPHWLPGCHDGRRPVAA